MKRIFYTLSIIVIPFLLAIGIFRYDLFLTAQAAVTVEHHPSVKYQTLQKSIVYEKVVEDETFENEQEIVALEDNITDDIFYPEEIQFAGDTYINLMNEEHLSSLVNLASQFNGALYGIPETDLFLIMQRTEPIFFMSTGVASVPLAHSDVLVQFFANKQMFDYENIGEHINKVIETGEEILVELDNYEGYYIFKEDNSIYVFW